MKLYLISQTQSTGYDTYDNAVVCAKSKKDAVSIHPSIYVKKASNWGSDYSWCSSPLNVSVKLLGSANKSIKRGVVCASFNAG